MLNKEQQEVFNEAVNGTNRVVFVTGEAGSGKSFVLTEIVKALVKKGKRVLVTATTNKAKNNLQEVLGTECFTVQSALGFVLIPKGKIQVLSSVRDVKPADVIVVDEVSMIQPKVFSKLMQSMYNKVLLFGDFAQLEPVGEKVNFSLLSTKPFVLKQQMRQDDSKLASTLNSARETISTRKIIDIHNLNTEKITIIKDHKEFCQKYKETTDGSKKILAYRNSVIDSYNNNINNGVRFSVGDNIILNKLLHPFQNGDTVTITNVEERETLFKLQVNNFHYIYVYKSKKLEAQALKDLDEDSYWLLKNQIFEPKAEYASTIHKAQGMSIDYVFIDIKDVYSQLTKRTTRFSPSPPLSINEYNRLVYVALSRVKKNAYLFIGDKRDYKFLRS